MKLNNIKNQMNQREIAPSAQAWDKLQARLDEEPASKKTWIYWVSGIAAAALLGFFLFPMLTTTTTIVEPGNQVVIEENTPQFEIEIFTPEITQEEIAIVEENEEVTVTTNSSTATQNKPVVRKAVPLKKAIIVATTNNKQHITSKDEFITQPTINNTQETVVASTTITNDRILEQPVVKQLTAAQEADLLLQKALGKQPKSDVVASKTVDAKMLLLETEWDVESDRRTRMQNTIQDGLKFLKTEAVALIDK